MALHGRYASVSVLIHLNTHKKNKILKGRKKLKIINKKLQQIFLSFPLRCGLGEKGL